MLHDRSGTHRNKCLITYLGSPCSFPPTPHPNLASLPLALGKQQLDAKPGRARCYNSDCIDAVCLLCLSHTQARITVDMLSSYEFTDTVPLTLQARSSKDPQCRFFARLAVAGLPRGGGDGDAIRHGILNIMRENGIKEGHRPVRG